MASINPREDKIRLLTYSFVDAIRAKGEIHPEKAIVALLKTILEFKDSTFNEDELFKFLFDLKIVRIKSDNILHLTYALINEFSKPDVIGIFEEVILHTQRDRIHQYTTPSSVIRLISGLSDFRDNQIIIDPVCGLGSFLSEANKHNKKLTLIGNDIDPLIIETAVLLSELKGENIQFLNSDFLEINDNQLPKADIVFAELPFGMHVRPDFIKYSPHIINNKVRRLDAILVERIINYLKTGGLAYIIVPESFLTGADLLGYRKWLTNTVSIEAIFSLPFGTFLPYTGIKANLLILKNKKQSNNVFLFDIKSINDTQFIDDYKRFKKGEKLLFGKSVPQYTKLENWSVQKYFSEIEINSELRGIKNKSKFFKLEDICLEPPQLITKSKHNFEDFDLIISTVFTPGKIIKSEVAETKSEKARYVGIKLNKNKALPEYVEYLFSHDLIKRKIKIITSGATIENISLSNLKTLELPIITPNEQLDLINKLQKVYQYTDLLSSRLESIKSHIQSSLFEIPDITNKDENLTEKDSLEFISKFPKPIANNYFAYRNTTDNYKKAECIFPCIDSSIITFAYLILMSIKDIEDDKLLKKITPVATRHLSDGTWKDLIISGIKYLDKSNSFISQYFESINITKLTEALDNLLKLRNKKGHSIKSKNDLEVKSILSSFETNIFSLLSEFSFLQDYPLIKVKGIPDMRPHHISHIVEYLVGDHENNKEDKVVREEEHFFTSLYYLSNKPNKSINLSPLMLYEENPAIKKNDIFFFSHIDKDKNIAIYKAFSGENEIEKDSEYVEEIKKIFVNI